MDIGTHIGYKGNLSSKTCKIIPYYADRNVEFIIHCPYFMEPTVFDNINVATSSATSSPASARSGKGGSPPKLDINLPDNLDVTESPEVNFKIEDSSNIPQAKNEFIQIVSEDLVTIIWIEDFTQALSIPKKLSNYFQQQQNSTKPSPQQPSPPSQQFAQNGYLYLFVHPLPHVPSLLWIRLVMLNGTPDPMLFGPLYDGMVISRHSLMLVRNTVIAAHLHLRTQRPNFRKP